MSISFSHSVKRMHESKTDFFAEIKGFFDFLNIFRQFHPLIKFLNNTKSETNSFKISSADLSFVYFTT